MADSSEPEARPEPGAQQETSGSPEPGTPETPAPEIAAAWSESPTVAIAHVPRATPTRVGPGTPPPPGVPPTPVRVPESAPQRRRRRWPLVLGIVVVVAAVAAAAALLSDRVGHDSTDADVRSAIGGYIDAVGRGDLTALRAGTCGDLAAYYGQVTDADFAQVHASANTDREVPILDSVDAVAVTDDTALTQVTVHMANAPTVTSVRSMSLELQDGTWRVCS